jgi:CheY-like chemotaxis protein
MDPHPEKPLLEKLLTKNILIIDDDGIITKTLCDLLNRSGFYTSASQNGFEGAEKTEEANFDLVICDIKMPEIDGIETIKRIREVSRVKNRPDIPVIFITGYPESEAAYEAQKLGEVLPKPFDNKEFLNRVAKYI